MAENNVVDMTLRVTAQGLELFDQAGKKVGEFGKEALDAGQKAEQGFGLVAAKVAVASVALAGIGAAALATKTAFDAFFSGVERGSQLNDLSQRLGVSVETLSRLELAAKTSGVSLDGLGTGIQQLSRNMVEAASGGKEAQAAFAALGISAADLGKLNTEEVLGRIADKFADSEDGAVKTAIAMQLLGRSGAQLIPLLNEGGAGLQRFGDLSEKLGLTMTAELAGAFDSIGDSMDILGSAVTGVQNQFAIGMAPALSEVAQGIVDFVAEIGIADGTIRGFGESVGGGLKSAFESIRATILETQELFATLDFDEAMAIVGNRLNVALEDAFETAIWAAARAARNVFSAAVASIFEDVDVGSLAQTKNIDLMREHVANLERELAVQGVGRGSRTVEDWRQHDPAVRQTLDNIAQLKDRIGELAGQQLVAQAAGAKHAAGLVDQQVAANLAALGIDGAADAFRFYEVEGVKGTLTVQKHTEAKKAEKTAVEQATDALLKSAGSIGESTELEEARTAAILEGIEAGDSYADIMADVETAELAVEAAQKLATGATLESVAAWMQAKVAAGEADDAAEKAAAQLSAVKEVESLKAQVAIWDQVEAGVISVEDAHRRLAILKETDKGLTQQQAEEVINYRDQVAELEDRWVAVGEKGVEVGALIGDAFSQTLDGIIAGTLDFGKIWESFTVSMGKQLFENLWNEKLNFDEGFKLNILDLVDWVGGAFGGGGGLFDGLLGGTTSGSGGGILSALGLGGGGGSALGTVLPLLASFAAGGGLGGFGGDAFSLGASSFSLANTGASLLGVGGGSGLIGALFGTGASSTTLGSLLGPGAGGATAGIIDTFFGAGSGASFLTGTTLGTLGTAASGVGSVVGGGMAAWGLGQGNFDAATVLSLVAATAAAINVLPVVGQIIYGVIVALTAIASAFTDITPTAGTLRRRFGESVLDQTPTFDSLQDQYGDLSRRRNNLGANPDLIAQREQLGEDALRDITGFATIFSQAVFGKDENGGFVATMAIQWTNILTDFFSRMEGESEEVSLAIRQNLLSAFKDLGVDSAAEAFGILNDAAERLIFPPQNFAFLEEAVDPAMMLGASIRGVASIFESELPAGVHIAALALESMENDGVKAFESLDTEGRETLLNLTDDAELFDKVVAKLFKDGFEIDTEEFEQRLKDITASAQFVGENIGQIFQFENIGVGIQAVMQSLKQTVLGTFQEIATKQLFENTNIAAVFEPVFNVLNRIEEFDLTTATGSDAFMAELLPALALGKANLEDYIPILQLMADNWKEIEKIIDEAMEPDDAEKAAIAVEQVFQGLGGILEESLSAGVAVLANGGTYQQALDVFKGTFATGVEAALKQAAFNAMVEAVVLQPLIQKWQPALEYVMTAGLTNGFNDPRVREAWRIVVQGLGDDAEALAPLVFDARLELEDGDAQIKRFFGSLQATISSLDQSLAGGISSLIRESIDIGIEDGLQAGQKHFAENIGDVMYDVLLDAIVRAFVDSVIVEGILGPVMAEGAALYAAAVDEASPGGKFITPEEQAGINEWRDYWREVFGIAREQAEDFGNWLIGEGVTLRDPEGGNPHDGYITTRRPVEDVDPISFNGRGRSLPVGGYDPETEGRRIVEQEIKPPAEALGDLIETEVIPGLSNFTDSVEEATRALRELQGGDPRPSDSGEDTGGGRRFPGSRTLDGAAAHGGTFGRGSTFLVGEEGPEVVVYGEDGSMEVIPIDRATMQSLLDGGVPGYARGTGRPSIGDFRGGRGGTRPPVGGGGGSGWGTGGPFIGTDDSRHPANNPNNRVGPVDVEIQLNLDEAIEDFLRGGSLSDLTKALNDGAREGVLEGLIAGMLESGPIANAIEAFNAQMSAEVEKAMKDGIISAQEQADLDALATKLSGNIETATQKMAPVVEGVGKALGIGIESSTKEAIDGITSNLDGAIRAFLEGGTIDDMEEAVNRSVYDGTTSAIIQALVTTGPLAAVIDKFGDKVGKAIADALDDGEIDEKEARRIRRIAKRYGGEISAAIEALGPVLGPIFEQWAAELGIDIRSELVTVEGVLTNALRSALLNGDSVETLKENIKRALYESVVTGMVDAFIDSAIIQGLLAGPMAVISGIFEQIANKQITVAEANNLIVTQFGVINGLLNDPAFLAALETFTSGIADLRATLGLTLQTTTNIADGFTDVAEQAEDACAGECEWERKLVESEQKNATLDEYGRAGYEVTEEWERTNKPPKDKPDTDEVDYGPGPYGDWDWTKSKDWRRERSRNRRRMRDDDDAPVWVTDPDIPWTEKSAAANSYAGRMASTNSGPIQVTDPMLDKRLQEMSEQIGELRQAILDRPVMLDGKDIAKNTVGHLRKQSRGGQSVLGGVS